MTDKRSKLWRVLALCLVAALFLMPQAAKAVEYDEFGFIIGNEPMDPSLPNNIFEEMVEPEYALRVDLKAQRTTAYVKDSKGQYTVPARVMKCSTGLDETPTPKGLFKSSYISEWYYFKEFEVWAQYATRINEGILFHSVLYSEPDVKTLQSGSVKKLGSKASHGCIRLSVEDAKWIYENCGAASYVHVLDTDPYRPADPKPTKKPTATPKTAKATPTPKPAAPSVKK